MKRILSLALAASMLSTLAWAGNDTKRGQAGASELLINPWARSTGWNGAFAGGCRGIESMMLNVAGLAFVPKTDLALSSQRYLSGSGIGVNTVGFAQKLGGSGVLGISLMTISLGDFQETTTVQPDGTGNTFKPQLYNLGLAYSKTFSSHITGGVLVRTVYQAISNVSALGVAFDAGIQYKGTNERFKFGIAIRNIGPKMRYTGEGLSFKSGRDQISLTVESKSAAFEMPSLLNISAGYDILKKDDLRLTGALAFVSNSYTKDQYVPGMEFSFREMFQVRTSYTVYQGLKNAGDSQTDVYTGWAFGLSFNLPITRKANGDVAPETSETATPTPDAAKNRSVLSVDYSYRATGVFSGTHSVGLSLSL